MRNRGIAPVAYSLMQAAQTVGRAKSTILRAIQSGKVSAMRDPVTGNWSIDPAELHRVYPIGTDTGPVPSSTVPLQSGTGVQQRSATAALQARLEAAEARISEMQEAQRLRDEVIADLRRQRDREAEERRQVQARLDAVLTDQRAAPPPPVPVRRRWWRWGMRG